MSETHKNRLVPKLRFPEFMNDSEWNFDSVENLILTISPPKKIISTNYLESGKYPIVDQSKSFYCGWTNDDDILINKDLPLIVFGDHTCIIKLVKVPFAQGADGIKIFKPIKLVTTEYLYHYLQYNGVQQENYKRHFSILKDKIVVFPINKSGEQQKIADCLSSLDEVITAESQKLEVLKDHKKGLLQNLFPQEGDASTGSAVPKLRFKEFVNSGEWEEKKLEEMYEFKVTNSLSRDCLNYEKGIVKNIHYGDIHTKFNTLFDITKEKVPFINPDIAINELKEDRFCINGDMVFADASEDLNDVGKSIEIVNLNNERLVSGLHTLLARQKVNYLAVGFGGYLFKSAWIRKQIQKEAQGAKVLGISANRISNIKIKFPKEKREQQKIASSLSSLDDLIYDQNQKVEALKLHKKGLLQGLFPDVNGVN